jgi:hypothetical protein
MVKRATAPIEKKVPLRVTWPRRGTTATTRRPYHNYGDVGVDWVKAFGDVDADHHHGKFARVSARHDVEVQTLRRRYWRWVRGGRRRASLVTEHIERRGGGNRAFTMAQQRALADRIRARYIDKGAAITDEVIAAEAMNEWNRHHPSIASRRHCHFDASAGWVSCFRKRWGMSSKRPQPRQEYAATAAAHTVHTFQRLCRKWLQRVGAFRFYNLDETRWCHTKMPTRVIANRGSRATVRYGGAIADAFTAVLVVSAAGRKLKPMIIRKGKTPRCLWSLNTDSIHSPIDCQFSENSFITYELLEHILDNVIAKHSGGAPSCLMLDRAAAHVDARIELAAVRNNIHLLWVPPASSGILQPLDVGVNGPLKAKAKKLWRKRMAKSRPIVNRAATALRHFAIAWRQITREHVQRGFAGALGIPWVAPIYFHARIRVALQRTRIGDQPWRYALFSNKPPPRQRRASKRRNPPTPVSSRYPARRRVTTSSPPHPPPAARKHGRGGDDSKRSGAVAVPRKRQRTTTHTAHRPSSPPSDPFAADTDRQTPMDTGDEDACAVAVLASMSACDGIGGSGGGQHTTSATTTGREMMGEDRSWQWQHKDDRPLSSFCNAASTSSLSLL